MPLIMQEACQRTAAPDFSLKCFQNCLNFQLPGCPDENGWSANNQRWQPIDQTGEHAIFFFNAGQPARPICLVELKATTVAG